MIQITYYTHYRPIVVYCLLFCVFLFDVDDDDDDIIIIRLNLYFFSII